MKKKVMTFSLVRWFNSILIEIIPADQQIVYDNMNAGDVEKNAEPLEMVINVKDEGNEVNAGPNKEADQEHQIVYDDLNGEEDQDLSPNNF